MTENDYAIILSSDSKQLCPISRLMRRNKHCKWLNVIAVTAGIIEAVLPFQTAHLRNKINYGFVPNVLVANYPITV